jgi:hypothetical protein
VKQVSQADRWCVLAFKADSRDLAVSGVEMRVVRGVPTCVRGRTV